MPTRRPHRARALATALALVAVLVACGDDDLTIPDVYGTYVLLRPSDVGTGDLAFYVDTLVFWNAAPTDGAVNQGRRKIVYEQPVQGGTTLVTHEVRFRFDVRDDEVRITFDCPPEADCPAGPHLSGPLDGDRLTLRVPAEPSLSALRYQRVARGG